VWQLNEIELRGAIHICTAGVSVTGSTTLACLILDYDCCADTQFLLCHDTLSVDGLLSCVVDLLRQSPVVQLTTALLERL
jgi:hypothetical protein